MKRIRCSRSAKTELRLLSAWEVLEACREGRELAKEGTERALCSNAALLARALVRGGTPIYEDARAVLEHLSVEEISRLADRWGAFNKAENPSVLDSPEKTEARKKVWSTRTIRAFNGACSVVSARFPRKNGPEQ